MYVLEMRIGQEPVWLSVLTDRPAETRTSLCPILLSKRVLNQPGRRANRSEHLFTCKLELDVSIGDEGEWRFYQSGLSKKRVKQASSS